MLTNNKTRSGFTLIEAMVTVAIIGILAGIAWPLFDAQQRRGHRSEAIAAAMRINNELANYFSDNNTYVGYTINTNITSGLKYYAATVPTLTATTYTVTLAATGTQTSDAECTALSIDQLGRKTRTGTASSASVCWGSN
ncbi:MAG: prepilin-type N-terminal cleavage/methylation domain-containing protein [Gammaproteobacteria bacterium]|nr:prepilin-type N-terminal cleavage/methylation domain-containing protein [Gammaproteobacteria bacterium]